MIVSEPEITLVTSNDGSVELTNYRLTYKTNEGKQQILLEDYTGCKQQKTSAVIFMIIAILFGSFMLLSFKSIFDYYVQSKIFDKSHPGFLKLLFTDYSFTGYLIGLIVCLSLYRLSIRHSVTFYTNQHSLTIPFWNMRQAV